MATGLEGNIKTPFGDVSKKTGLIIAGAAVLVFGYTYYRAKKAKDAAATAAAGANTEIDPATGYAYGSPEDAAALSAQAQYNTPTGGSGGGGSSTGAYPSGSFTTNAGWTQAVLSYFGAEGFADLSAMSSALGKYLAGQPVSDTDKSLIEQAIAVQGYPPISGPNGYPPSVNTAPAPPSGSGSNGGGTTPPPTGAGGYDTSKWQAKGSVLPGYKVDQWINDLIAQGKVPPNFTYENTLKPRNPGIEKNIVWHANSSQNYFKAAATYNLKW